MEYQTLEKTIYDLGTGVIPAFRKRGVTQNMLSRVQTICRVHGIGGYQLEVIQDNTAAVSLYKKQSFQVMRSLNCYVTERISSEPEIELCAVVNGHIVGTAGVKPVGQKDKVRQAGYSQLELNVVAENERAISLYESGKNSAGA